VRKFPRDAFDWFLIVATVLHLFFMFILDKNYVLAPDEERYLYTFSNLYDALLSSDPQYQSGWTYAPKIFLIIVFLPAKLLTLFGVSNLIAIRLLSFVHFVICSFILRYLIEELKPNNRQARYNLIFFLLTPSIILWTSLSLRESFLMLSILTLYSVLYSLDRKNQKYLLALAFIASYSILSIKYYQWALIAISILIYSCIRAVYFRTLVPQIKLLFFTLFFPLLIFTLTAPSVSQNISLKLNFDAISSRSGDSVTILNPDQVGSLIPEEEILIRSDSTVIDFLAPNNSESRIFKLLDSLGLVNVFRERLGNVIKNKDSELSNQHALKPGKIQDPLSLVWPSLKYYFGPVFSFDVNFFHILILLESPIWWLLAYLVVMKMILVFRRKDVPVILKSLPALLYVFSHILVAGLIEVNVGTAARHKSILMMPLLLVLIIFNSSPSVDKKQR
jgi:hypothetical protein